MFSGYREVCVTKDGRQSKPTSKVKALLQDAVAGTLKRIAQQMSQKEKKMRASMQAGESATIVQGLYRAWDALLDDFGTTEQELRMHLSPEDLLIHERLVARKYEQYEQVKDDANDYMASKARPSSVGRARELARDTLRLEEQIHQIEDRLSKASVKLHSVRSQAGSLNGSFAESTLSADMATPRGHSTPRRAPAKFTLPDKVVYFRNPLEDDSKISDESSDELDTSYPRSRQPDDPTLEAITRLAGLLDHNRSRLPDMEPEVFHGDILQYPLWIKSFEALVEQRTTSVTERLHFLGRYTAGDARECVAGYLALYSADAFARAKAALRCRYGDKLRVSEAYRRKLMNWPTIKKNDAAAMRKLSDFMWQCNAAMQAIGQLRSLNNAEDITRILRAVPAHLNERWDRFVDNWYYRDNADPREFVPDYEGEYPPFKELCKFLAKEARILHGPSKYLHQESVDASVSKSNAAGKNPKKAHTFATTGQDTADSAGGENAPRSRGPPVCYFCSGAHVISQCDKFLRQGTSEKKAFAVETKLCFGCLKKGHSYRRCRFKNPELLGEAERAVAKAHVNHVDTRMTAGVEPSFYSMIVLVEVSHPTYPGLTVCTYALLDTQSDSCFLSDELAAQLEAPAHSVELELSTIGSVSTISSQLIEGLNIRGLNCDTSVQIPKAYTRSCIPANRASIPRPETIRAWPHLRSVADQMPAYRRYQEVGLLIGYNCPGALIPRALAQADDDAPCGVLTRLGWGVLGKVPGEQAATAHCFSATAKDVSMKEVNAAFDSEFLAAPDDVKVSHEDRLFMDKMNESMRHLSDGHFEMELPLRNSALTMPNNRQAVYGNLRGLKKRLKRDPLLHRQYAAFIQELLDQGHAELAPATAEEGKVNYLPHHGVRHPRKPDKLRVVWNGSSVYDGVSLNQELLAGPDLTNNLVGVLCRFRQERVAFMCDIKGMFLQVRVATHHRDFLRFLWFEGGDLEGEVVEYRMSTHLFGATSSPSCANLALKTAASELENVYGAPAAEFVRSGFYVDDGLSSESTPEKAAELFNNAHQICAGGGFLLCKFVSNSPEAIQLVEKSLRATSIKEWNFASEVLPTETSLGLQWMMAKDCFVFTVRRLTQDLTRRGLLSSLGSIYDPIGFLAPLILVGRVILQELCTSGVSWDEPIPPPFAARWREWYDDLSHLEELRIPRCVRSNTWGDFQSIQLHHFCDASTSGFGACSYLRLEDLNGQVDVTLIAAKARVAPKKPVTMPRMELQAAVAAAKLAGFLRKELPYQDAEEWYWSDSRVVLGYLRNETRRFHLYVANRVQYIRERSEATRWNHVRSQYNPADLASRGCAVHELIADEQWWSGPAFLRSDWSLESGAEYTIDEADPEVRQPRSVVHDIKIAPESGVEAIISRASTWSRARSHLLVWRRYISLLRGRCTGDAPPRKGAAPLPLVFGNVEVYRAEHVLILSAQRSSFSEELGTLKRQSLEPESLSEARQRKGILKQRSPLYGLNAFLTFEGLLRVGGRLNNSTWAFEQKHPLILPADHKVTRLLIEDIHARKAHPGRQTTLALIRVAGYWPIHGRSTVEKCLRDCVICRRFRGRPIVQQMASLPEARSEEAPPFTHCGMDLFGPFLVKENRSQRKRWICLFTCFGSRAVHLEPVHSLSTDSFLQAFRRFSCRRGAVRSLYCDRGTNFVGAAHELEDAMKELDWSKLKVELMKHRCELPKFNFNAPKASHMGGVWERLIRTVRQTMIQLLHRHNGKLTDEVLNTVLVEAEGLVNSRPLATQDLSDPLADPPITPLRLLTLKSTDYQPLPGNFQPEDHYSKKRWRQVQQLAQEFWRQWRGTYLAEQQSRKKWIERASDVKVDDIVVLMDESLPRGQWPLASVVEVLPSRDGLIRKVIVKTQDGRYERPVCKLIHLCSSEK